MVKPVPKPKITIAGLGNELLADDGVGLHAARLLRLAMPEDIQVMEIGTSILRAQDIFENSDIVIALDAVKADSKPGTVYMFDLSCARLPSNASLHDLGVTGLLKLIPEDKRPHTIVIGIEPELIDYSMQLSATVQHSLNSLIRLVKKTVEKIDRTGKRAGNIPARNTMKGKIQSENNL